MSAVSTDAAQIVCFFLTEEDENVYDCGSRHISTNKTPPGGIECRFSNVGAINMLHVIPSHGYFSLVSGDLIALWVDLDFYLLYWYGQIIY